MEGEEAAVLAAYTRRPAPASGLAADPGPPPCRAVRRRGRWLEQQGETVAPAQPADDARFRRAAGGTPPVILIDTIGELAAVWGLADVAFVGGSLPPGRGGQNMMEPAAYRRLGDVRPPHRQLPRDGRPTAPSATPRGRSPTPTS